MNSVPEQIKRFLVRDILSGEDPASIHPDTNLKESGILDSLSTLKLVSLLERQYKVAFEERDLKGDNFSTIANIERLVNSKLNEQR